MFRHVKAEFNIVLPDTVNVLLSVVILFNIVVPDTCNNALAFPIPIPTLPFVFIVILSRTVKPVDIDWIKSPEFKCENTIE